jgi:hypothetical protein
MIGMPTPTVAPARGVTTVAEMVRETSRVRKELRTVLTLPFAPTTVALIAYLLPGLSAHRGHHWLPSALTRPSSRRFPSAKATERIRPSRTVAVTEPSGRIPLVPSAGTTTTVAPFRGTVVP